MRLSLRRGPTTVPFPWHYARLSTDTLSFDEDGGLEVWWRNGVPHAGTVGDARTVGVGDRMGDVEVCLVEPVAVERTLRARPRVEVTSAAVLIRQGEEVRAVGAHTGRMLRALIEAREEPVGWKYLAGRLWPGSDPESRRKDFENQWVRSRGEFEELGVPGLVWKPGPGLYMLNREWYQVPGG